MLGRRGLADQEDALPKIAALKGKIPANRPDGGVVDRKREKAPFLKQPR